MSSTLDFDQQTSPSPSSNHLANGDQATTSTSLRFSSGSRSGTGSPGLHDRAAEDGANTLGRLGSVEGEGDVDGEGDAHDGVGDTPVTGTKRKRPVKKLRMKPLAEVLARLITGVKKCALERCHSLSSLPQGCAKCFDQTERTICSWHTAVMLTRLPYLHGVCFPPQA